jgi:hypothetical protein
VVACGLGLVGPEGPAVWRYQTGARVRWTFALGVIGLVTVVAPAGVGSVAVAHADPRSSPATMAPAASPAVTPPPTVPPLGASGIPFRFRADPFAVRELALKDRPGSSRHVCPKVDHGIHDAQGVRMRRLHGKLFDFPRGQSAYGLANLNSYRVTGDEFYLERALAQADRLVEYHADAGGAWYFPTYPSRSRHGRTQEWIRAPYYSALPEGRILQFFSRLAEVTGRAEWRDAADHVFKAFLRVGPRSGPYILDIDDEGYYWLQEWPWPGMQPDDTLNGHITSLYGLYEYYTVTHDGRAKALFRGAVTTVKHYLPRFRRAGWISCYCLLHRATNENYHGMHIGQLLKLYLLTGAPVFARAADAFMSDYPRPQVSGSLHVAPGVYEAIRVSASGAVIGRRIVRVRQEALWRTATRKRLWPRSPICLRAGSGPAKGWWLPERAGRVYLLGIAEQHGYTPARRLTVAAGEDVTALKYDDLGRVTARQRVSAGDGLTLRVDARAVINGSPRVRVNDGDLAGYWLQLRSRVHLY